MNNKGSNNSIGFSTLLAVLFIGLKLAGCIRWSWIWVLSPLWGFPFLFFLGVFIYLILEIFKKKN